MKTHKSDLLDNPEFIQWLVKAVRKKEERSYSAFRVFPDKRVQELGTVRDLLEAIKAAEGQHGIRNLNANKTDPPDCIGIGSRGDRIGFEVTELVDQTTIERNRRGRSDWKEWEPDEFRTKLNSILEQKDGKQLRGGPFDKFVVVIHTDEPLLPHCECSTLLTGHRFGPFQQIDEAFLLFSSEPGRSSDPYIRLDLY